MSTKKRRQTMAKFTREQAVKEKRARKREKKEEQAAAARIARASGYEPAQSTEDEGRPVPEGIEAGEARPLQS